MRGDQILKQFSIFFSYQIRNTQRPPLYDKVELIGIEIGSAEFDRSRYVLYLLSHGSCRGGVVEQ